MQRANRFIDRALRGGLAAVAACACIAPALAGGPLFVVPSGGTLKPARWEGTVKVYTDQGTLGALDNATANKLVANTVKQWSSVPTSSFRAVIAGQLPFDVTGANAGQIIGASNGGGIQIIYDSDGSVIGDFMGAGPGVLGIASPEYLAGPDSNQIVEGWVIIRGETVSGNSVIRLAQKMDAGAILAQSRVDIAELETAGELHDRLAENGATLVPRVVEELIAGSATETPQDEALATLAPKMSREQSKLDFSRRAAEIANQICGMYPWPGCRVRLTDEHGAECWRATLVRARVGTVQLPRNPAVVCEYLPQPGVLTKRQSFHDRVGWHPVAPMIGAGDGTAIEVVEMMQRLLRREVLRRGIEPSEGLGPQQ